MIADRLPCGLVHVNDSSVEIVVTAGKNIEGSEDLQAHLMSIFDEIAEHIVITRTLNSFPVTHVWSDLTVIENFAHDGLHVYDNISKPQILRFLQIIAYRIRM